MAGEYQIRRKIGSGGFGTVYEAEHPILKRRAAVKVLHPNRLLDPVVVARFVAEAQSASQIRHRHIVDIFSFGTLPGGQYFYVMDFLQGETLDRFLCEHPGLSPELAIALLRPVAQALDALHAVGIVHRDIKPPNIYLAWDSSDEVVPKLLDFGLVKLLGETPIQTASGVPMGTPHYMSPEQCRGERVDARSDVYAFGVVCHELLAGQPPFTGDSAAAVLVAHVLEPPPRLTQVRPDLPSQLDEPVLQMLAKTPAERPSSAGEAFGRLEQAARAAGLNLSSGLPHLPRPPESVATGSDFVSQTVGVGSNRVEGASSRPSQTAEPRIGIRILALVAVLAAGALAVPLLFRGKTDDSQTPPPAVSGSALEMGSAAPISKPEPTESASAKASAAAPSEEVQIVLRGAPQGAQVFREDERLGEVPGPFRLPRGDRPLDLNVRAAGYQPTTVSVVPSENRELVVSLTRLSEPARGGSVPGKGRPISRDLENPF